jgi:hypothetical protein
VAAFTATFEVTSDRRRLTFLSTGGLSSARRDGPEEDFLGDKLISITLGDPARIRCWRRL